jgi:hypothetical protein
MLRKFSTSENAPRLIHLSSLLCPASIQQYNQDFLNLSQSRNLNASFMFFSLPRQDTTQNLLHSVMCKSGSPEGFWVETVARDGTGDIFSAHFCGFHTVDTVHLRHIKLSYRPTDAH